MSREAAAALICKLGCLTELLQSRALANVPTDLTINKKRLEQLCQTTLEEIRALVLKTERQKVWETQKGQPFFQYTVSLFQCPF